MHNTAAAIFNHYFAQFARAAGLRWSERNAADIDEATYRRERERYQARLSEAVVSVPVVPTLDAVQALATPVEVAIVTCLPPLWVAPGIPQALVL